MNNEIMIEAGDRINLTTGYIVEIIQDQVSEPYSGSNLNNGEEITFKENEIECIKKNYVKPCGGDMENYWFFYCGAGYKTRLIDIANYARYEFENLFFDMTVEEIMKNHIYWGTDESTHFKAMYNGDTFILYYNINALPEDLKADAQWFKEHH